MSTGHDFQQLTAQKGGAVVTACRFCLCSPGDPKAKEPCAANMLASMPPGNAPKSLVTQELRPAEKAMIAAIPRSAVDLVKSLNAEEIESKIAEMRGEIAGLEVLLAAARARDSKYKKDEATLKITIVDGDK